MGEGLGAEVERLFEGEEIARFGGGQRGLVGLFQSHRGQAWFRFLPYSTRLRPSKLAVRSVCCCWSSDCIASACSNWAVRLVVKALIRVFRVEIWV